MSVIPQRILATLLHYANADPSWMRREFYALKDRLLRKYGTFRGHHIQEITKECWGRRQGWDEYGDYRYSGCTKDEHCWCNGTGIFDRKWIPNYQEHKMTASFQHAARISNTSHARLVDGKVYLLIRLPDTSDGMKRFRMRRLVVRKGAEDE